MDVILERPAALGARGASRRPRRARRRQGGLARRGEARRARDRREGPGRHAPGQGVGRPRLRVDARHRPRGRAAGALSRLRQRGREGGLTAFTAEKRKPEFKGRCKAETARTRSSSSQRSSRGSRSALSSKLELPALAEDTHRHLCADPLHDHQALDVVDAGDGGAVELDDQVLRSQARPLRRACPRPPGRPRRRPRVRAACQRAAAAAGAPPAIPR